MPSVNTLTQLDAAAKQLYKDANYNEDLLVDRVLYGLLPKDTSFGGSAAVDQSATVAGRGMPLVLRYGRTAGASLKFASAQTAAQNKQASIKAFQFKHVNDYCVFQVSGEEMDIERSTAHSFVTSLKMAMDDAAETLADKLDIFSYRTGDGMKAVVKTVDSPATNDITLTNAQDAVNFDLNELTDYTRVNTSVTANKPAFGGVGLRTLTSDTSGKISAIDLDTGFITITLTSEVASLAAGDGIGSLGDTQGSGAARVKISGLAAWIPDKVGSGATSELAMGLGSSTNFFFGIDRSVSYKLAGSYMDHSTLTIEAALVKAQASLGLRGAAPSIAIVPHDQYRALNEQLGAKREYCDVNATGERGLIANINYGGVYVHGIRGVLKVVPALHAPVKRAWLIEPKDWVMYSAGEAISMQDRDGLTILRKSDSDDYEGRMVFRGNLVCRLPGRQGQVKLAAV